MTKTVRLVHISDLHAQVANKSQIALRVQAFFDDLKRHGQGIDAVLFTGDMAFAGRPEEYQLAERILLTPLMQHFGLSKKQIFIIPGNHDIDRSVIDPYTESGMVKTLQSSEDAEAVLEHPQHSLKRLENYSNFNKSFFRDEPAVFYVRKLNIAGLTFGFACLNSAWRCSGDEDKQHLFITAKQVLPALDELQDCHIKVGLVHHPFDWLHPNEFSESVPDLKRRLNLILMGHLHVALSTREMTPQSDSLILSAPALSDSRQDVVGYNIYDISYPEKKITVHYRKFFRQRGCFDKDTAYAEDGQAVFHIATDALTFTQGVLCQRITTVGTAVDSAFRKNLSEFQETDPPIYVTPAVQRVVWSNKMPQYTALPEIVPILATHAVIYGPREVGKTVLLQALASSANATASNEGGNRLAVYVDFDRTKNINIKRKITSALSNTLSGLRDIPLPPEIIFCVDHMAEGNDFLDDFRVLAEQNPGWRFLVTVDNPLQLDAAAARRDVSGWSFYQMSYWGPGRIREFVKTFFSKDGCEIDVAYDFITNSLRNTDLPATPMVVILYLAAFRLIGEERTSLSFLHLLQTFESHRLSHSDNSSTNALHNKQRILGILAAQCAAESVIALPKTRVEEIVTDYFGKLLLEVKPQSFIQELVRSGILKQVDDEIAFTRYIFLEYYLARAFQYGIAQVDHYTKTLFQAVEVSNALALYGGIVRDNEVLPHRLISLLSQYSSVKSGFSLADLDQYIKDILLPYSPKEIAEKIATADIEARVDYHQQDEDFVRDKEQYEQERKDKTKFEEPTTNMERLGLTLYGLKVFYNVFRNLENLSGDDKVLLLDHILDFHIQANIETIHFYSHVVEDVDFQTLFAYLFTIGGQHFLSSNLGNQSLKLTIEEAIKLCGKNDFKELLLRIFYADLRLPEHEKRLAAFVEKTQSRAAIEIIYLKLRELMIKYEKKEIPLELISAFRSVCAKRESNKEKRHRDQKKDDNGVILRLVEAQVQQVKQQHIVELAKSS